MDKWIGLIIGFFEYRKQEIPLGVDGRMVGKGHGRKEHRTQVHRGQLQAPANGNNKQGGGQYHRHKHPTWGWTQHNGCQPIKPPKKQDAHHNQSNQRES